MTAHDESKTPVSLLEAVRLGRTPEAWGVFCARYQPRIAAWCARWGGTAEDAEDVTQETLLKVFRHIVDFQYNPQLSFRAWLKTVARRVSMDVAELERRHQVPPGPLAGARPDLVRPGPFSEAAGKYTSLLDQIADQELLELARHHARERVSPLVWECYERAELLGEPREEIARSLGIADGFLRVNIHRVRQMIHEEGRRLDPG